MPRGLCKRCAARCQCQSRKLFICPGSQLTNTRVKSVSLGTKAHFGHACPRHWPRAAHAQHLAQSDIVCSTVHGSRSVRTSATELPNHQLMRWPPYPRNPPRGLAEHVKTCKVQSPEFCNFFHRTKSRASPPLTRCSLVPPWCVLASIHLRTRSSASSHVTFTIELSLPHPCPHLHNSDTHCICSRLTHTQLLHSHRHEKDAHLWHRFVRLRRGRGRRAHRGRPHL
jgi:hypothetical protein